MFFLSCSNVDAYVAHFTVYFSALPIFWLVHVHMSLGEPGLSQSSDHTGAQYGLAEIIAYFMYVQAVP